MENHQNIKIENEIIGQLNLFKNNKLILENKGESKMDNFENEFKQYMNLKENYNVITLLYKKEKQEEIYNKLNIIDKNRSEIYLYD